MTPVNYNRERKGQGARAPREKPEFDQKTIGIRRVTRVVKGGRRFSFAATVAIGDRQGRVGLGVGKAADVALSLDKAVKDAKKNLLKLKLTKDAGVPCELSAKFASSRLWLNPAPGRGLTAGSSARVILELAGIRHVTAKFFSRSKNKLNNARAVMAALKQIVN